jgi:hypothetical protein
MASRKANMKILPGRQEAQKVSTTKVSEKNKIILLLGLDFAILHQ